MFYVYTSKPFSGRGDEIVELARTNFRRADPPGAPSRPRPIWDPCTEDFQRRHNGVRRGLLIRHLQSLARKRALRARAGALCNVTQSTLSAGIKQLEESLGVLIVERGHAMSGLTDEGGRGPCLGDSVRRPTTSAFSKS